MGIDLDYVGLGLLVSLLVVFTVKDRRTSLRIKHMKKKIEQP